MATTDTALPDEWTSLGSGSLAVPVCPNGAAIQVRFTSNSTKPDESLGGYYVAKNENWTVNIPAGEYGWYRRAKTKRATSLVKD